MVRLVALLVVLVVISIIVIVTMAAGHSKPAAAEILDELYEKRAKHVERAAVYYRKGKLSKSLQEQERVEFYDRQIKAQQVLVLDGMERQLPPRPQDQ